MITAKNYAAQACKGISYNANLLDGIGEYKAAKYHRLLEDEIRSSVHFAIEDNGSIFNDGFKGIKGQNIRLPFKSITIEYFANKCSVPGLDQAKKRVILAQEVSTEYVEKKYPEFLASESSDICIVIVCAYESDSGQWIVTPVMGIIDTHWESYTNNIKKSGASKIFDDEIIKQRKGIQHHEAGVFYAPINSIYDVYRNPKASEEENMMNFSFDCSTECCAMLEFIEALSCANVSHSIYQKECKSINAKREKKGKVPIWETKILTIDTKQESKSGTTKTGGHASPRQHLRRGHIRRLPNKNIWVNSCVVGDKANGVIEKQYRVK